jgi:hypothetical protein
MTQRLFNSLGKAVAALLGELSINAKINWREILDLLQLTAQMTSLDLGEAKQGHVLYCAQSARSSKSGHFALATAI